MDKATNHHTKLMILSAVFGFQTFMGPILVVFYTNYMGLSFSQYCLLDSILFSMVAIFEVPSGYLADLVGRKKMLLVSQIFTIISMIVLIMWPSYIGAFISIMIAGIFIPLGSGNADAIYFESFQKVHKESELEKVYAKCNSISFVISIIVSVVSGFLAAINLAIPVMVDIGMLVLTLFATKMLLHDNPSLYVNKQPKKQERVNLYNSFINNIKKLLNVTPFFLIMALVFAVLRGSYSFYQPLFSHIGIRIEYFGVIFASFSLISAIASYLAPKVICKAHGELGNLLAFMGLLAVSFIGIRIFSNYALLIFIGLQQIVRGFYRPFFSVRKNSYVPKDSAYRVTYLSYANLLSTLLVSFSLILLSVLNKFCSLVTAISCFGAIILSLLGGSILIHYILKKRGKIICYQYQQ